MMNRIISQAIAALLLLLLITYCQAWEKRIDSHGKTIIAYYASWQWYDRNGLAKPENLDHSKVTRYNFAFFQINEQGQIWGTDSWADPIVLFGEFDWMAAPGTGYCSWDSPDEPPVCAGHFYEGGLIHQAHSAGVEVYPSIGGWTLSDPFPTLAANPTARATFAANCVELIKAYDFDGIDIDWEYPGYAAHSGTPEDTVNYSLFLQEIRDALDILGEETGRFYGLTAALPCGPDLIDNIEIMNVKDILTEFNLMTYDFHGSWNSKTGSNAPLYDMDGSPEFSVHGCVENWKEGGARPDQINIGLPFYGRSFGGPGMTGFGQTHAGYADMVTWSDDEGSPQYFNIVDKLSQFTSVRDTQTMTQFAYNTNGFVSYDDERAICDKTEYAMNHNLNGYIIWEISGDLLPDLSTPLLDATNDRLNTNVPCEPGTPLSDMITDEVWYPSAVLGYCLNDGKQLENFVAPDQMFASAVKCCGTNYAYSSDCVDSSLNPGSDGQFVDDAAQENPWYPVQSLGYCVNDGNEANHFISDDFKFTSAAACCQRIYSFETTCLASSLEPGSDGHFVFLDTLTNSNPWYPHPSKGYCVDDGKEKKHFISDNYLYTSAEACCDTIYSFDTSCLEASSNSGSDKQLPGLEENGNPWYPHPSIGYCMNDGSHDELFIAPDRLFPSIKECCESDYVFNENCVEMTKDPGSNGLWVEGNKDPWYPHHSLRICVNDGNQDDFNVLPEFMFQSVEQCCDTALSFSRTCLSHSLDPSGNGIWLETDYGDGENPYYPHPGLQHCVKDGKHHQFFIPTEHLFSNVEACCDTVYPSSRKCVASSLNPESDGFWVDGISQGDPWYFSLRTSGCVSDGKHSKMYTPAHLLFVSAEACCEAVDQKTPKTCISISLNPAKNDGKWYAYGSHCSYETPVPKWAIELYETERECCEEHFGRYHKSCVIATIAEPTPKPPKGQNNPVVLSFDNIVQTNINDNDPLYYPHYDEDGTSAECRNDGSAPSWFTADMFRQNRYDCCSTYFFPAWSDECNTVMPLYYPNFADGSCVNDRNHGGIWMAGDYFADSLWLCCNNFFQNDATLLSNCVGNGRLLRNKTV